MVEVSPWVKHFAFPVCFILVAVKWPYRIEKGLTQNLMQIVASLTVEIIGWFGIPAIQRGDLIEISTGVLGLDEACSGIRSCQSTLMAGLFLGELYLLRWPIRLLLVGAGLALQAIRCTRGQIPHCSCFSRLAGRWRSCVISKHHESDSRNAARNAPRSKAL